MTATPDEQRLSDEYGAPVREVSSEWIPPFQPWVADQADPQIDWWAWRRHTDTFTPVYARP